MTGLKIMGARLKHELKTMHIIFAVAASENDQPKVLIDFSEQYLNLRYKILKGKIMRNFGLAFGILVFFVGISTASAQQQPSIFDQYRAALPTLIGENLNPKDYRERLFEDLAGDWFWISALAPSNDNQNLFAKMCEDNPLKISVRNEYAFEVVKSKAVPVTTIYTSRSGTLFAQYTEITTEMRRLGVNAKSQDITQADLVERVLKNNNGIVSITRPTKDILILQSQEKKPEIWARCK